MFKLQRHIILWEKFQTQKCMKEYIYKIKFYKNMGEKSHEDTGNLNFFLQILISPISILSLFLLVIEYCTIFQITAL